MIEQITINGKSYTVTPDEQGYYTVDLSGESLDTFTIDTRSICDGGIELSNVQINEGNTRKDFVLPTASVTKTATGIYQSLSDLRLTLTNAEQGLRQELNLMVDGLADRIEQIDTNGTKQLQQTIVTVDGLRQDIQTVETNASTQLNTLKNTVNGLEQSIERVEADGKSTMASYKQTLDTLQAQFKESQQTVNGATQTKLNNLESTIDGLNQTIQNTIQNVDSVQSVANEAKETAQGLQRQITQIEQSTGKGYLSYTVDANGAKWNPSNNAKAVGAGQGISAAIYDEVKANGAKFMRIDSDRIYPIASYSDTNKTIGIDTSQYSRDFEITTGTHTYEFAPSRNGFPSGSIAQYLIEQTAEGLRSQIKTIEATATNASTQLNEVIRTAEATQSKVTDVEKQVSSNYTQLSNLISQKVSSQDVQTMIQQSEDRIKLQVSQGKPDGEAIVSAINLTPDLVRIKGNSIRLDGEAIIQDSVIKSSHIESLTADKITVGTLDAAKVRVINLDANSISGLEARIRNMKTAILEPLNSGSMRWDLDNNKLTFFTNSSIEFQDDRNALWRDYRASNGNIHTSFLNFTVGSGGSQSVVALGTQRYGHSFNSNNNYFTGIRIFPTEDTVSAISDKFYITDGVENEGTGIFINTRSKTIEPGKAHTGSLGSKEFRFEGLYVDKMYPNSNSGGFIQMTGFTNDSITISNYFNSGQREGVNFGSAGEVSYEYRSKMYPFKDLFRKNGYQFSDARMKENINVSKVNATEILNKLEIYSFTYKDKTDNPFEPHGHLDAGFIAQQAKEVNENFVMKPLNEGGNLSINSATIFPYTVKAIQELSKKIKELEDEIKTLSGNEH